MKQIKLILLTTILITACTNPSSVTNFSPDHHTIFQCNNGETLSISFYTTRQVAVLVRNGDKIELPQQRSGSGFIYSNGPNTIRGKGNNLTVTIGRMMPLECTGN